MHMDELLGMADALGDTPPDDQEWREIVAEVMDKVVTNETDISVLLRDEYRPLLSGVSENGGRR